LHVEEDRWALTGLFTNPDEDFWAGISSSLMIRITETASSSWIFPQSPLKAPPA